jgi:hypothetical protein
MPWSPRGHTATGRPSSSSLVFHLAGALNDRKDDDGAVGNRDARYIGGFSGTWPPGAPAEPHVTWVRESWARIRPFSTGGNYVNFQLADYDPDNLFRVNRNIPPAA